MATTTYKISGATAPSGKDGEVKLVTGKAMSMRLWRDEQPHDKTPHKCSYETLGYVIAGKAELVIAGETVRLEAGDSWIVPAEAEHTYRILETFTAVECISPPTA